MIGQNPGQPRRDGKLPTTSALHRLNDWMRRAGVRNFSFVNVYQEPGPFRRDYDDEQFAISCVAMHAWRAMNAGEKIVIVAMGSHASRVLDDIEHVRWPHPSGLNRQINDPRNVTSAINRLRRALCT